MADLTQAPLVAILITGGFVIAGQAVSAVTQLFTFMRGRRNVQQDAREVQQGQVTVAQIEGHESLRHDLMDLFKQQTTRIEGLESTVRELGHQVVDSNAKVANLTGLLLTSARQIEVISDGNDVAILKQELKELVIELRQVLEANKGNIT